MIANTARRVFEDTAGDRIEVGVVDTAGKPPYFFHITVWSRGALAIAELDRDMARALAADLLAFADSTPETMENEG